MEKTYRVVFQGVVANESLFRTGMKALGVSGDVVDRLLGSAPVAMKRDLTLRDARAYAEAVQEAGGKVSIQEHGWTREDERPPRRAAIPSLEAFTECPECGLKQLRAPFCERCGCSLASLGHRT